MIQRMLATLVALTVVVILVGCAYDPPDMPDYAAPAVKHPGGTAHRG